MLKRLLKISALAVVGLGAWLAVNLYDSHTLKKGMPPGYYLECDAAGRYRACRGGRALFDLSDPSSKVAAIRRAWVQYEYDSKLAGETWNKCE